MLLPMAFTSLEQLGTARASVSDKFYLLMRSQGSQTGRGVSGGSQTASIFPASNLAIYGLLAQLPGRHPAAPGGSAENAPLLAGWLSLHLGVALLPALGSQTGIAKPGVKKDR